MDPKETPNSDTTQTAVPDTTSAQETSAKESQVTTPVAGVETDATPTTSTMSPDWFIDNMKTFSTTGKVDLNEAPGFYLGTRDQYYNDPAVRKAFKQEFGTDNQASFDMYYKMARQSYLEQVQGQYMETKVKASQEPHWLEAFSDDRTPMGAAINQMRYNDGRSITGEIEGPAIYSDDQGPTDMVLSPDGELIGTAGDYEGLLEDERLIDQDGRAPQAFKYLNRGGERGGLIAPVYEDSGYSDRENIVSRYVINDDEKIYKEANNWSALATPVVNGFVSFVDNTFFEYLQWSASQRYGEDVENKQSFHNLNDVSNSLMSRKMSPSDEGRGIGSLEGIYNTTVGVASQVFGLSQIHKKGGRALTAFGVNPSTAFETSGYWGRAWMTNTAALEAYKEGRALGMTHTAAASTTSALMMGLWSVNSVFNWAEQSVESAALKGKFKKLLQDRMKEVAASDQSYKTIVASGASFPNKVIKSLFGEKGAARLSGAGKALVTKADDLYNKIPANTIGEYGKASINEGLQETSEFLVEETIKNASNLARYVNGGYYDEDAPAFVGYQSMTEKGYFTEHFMPGLWGSAVGGLLGGPMGRLIMGGASPQVESLMVHAILTDNVKSYVDARDELNAKGAFGNKALSMLKDEKGEYYTMAEAREQNPDAVDQNAFNLNAIESEFNFKLQMLSSLHLKGAGANSFQSIKDNDPELYATINEYEPGKLLKQNLDIIEKITKNTISIAEIAAINNTVVRLRDDYVQSYHEAENQEGKDAAAETRDIGEQELRDELIKTNKKITPEEAQQVIDALQAVTDITHGRDAELLFLTNLYKSDAKKAPELQLFAPLAGNKYLESVESIKQELEVMSDARDYRKKLVESELALQRKNGELLDEDGTYAEKVASLKNLGDVIPLTQEGQDKLNKEYDYVSARKDHLLYQLDRMQVEDYAKVSTLLNEVMELDPDEPKYDAKLLAYSKLPNLHFDTNADGTLEFNPETTMDFFKKKMEAQIKGITTLNQFKDLYMEVPMNDFDPELTLKVIATETPVLNDIFLESFPQQLSPEELDNYTIAQELHSKMKLRELTPWDDTDMGHLYADYKIVDGKLKYQEGSSLTVSAQTVYQEALNPKTFDHKAKVTTYGKFDEAEGLKGRLVRRLSLLKFLETADPLLGRFRRGIADQEKISFDFNEPYDKELTRFNREFNKALYNPARKIELNERDEKGTLSASDQKELDKLNQILFSFTGIDEDKIAGYENALKARDTATDAYFKSMGNEDLSAEEANDIYQAYDEANENVLMIESQNVKGLMGLIISRLNNVLGTKKYEVSKDLQKTLKFKQSVTKLHEETLVSFNLLTRLHKGLPKDDTSTVLDEVNNNPIISVLAKSKVPDLSMTDREIQVALQLIIEGRDEIHRLYGDKLETLIQDYKKDTEFTDNKRLTKAVYIAGFNTSEYIGRYKGYVDLENPKSKTAHFGHPVNHQQFSIIFNGVSYLTNPAVRNFTHAIYTRAAEGFAGVDPATYVPSNMFSIQGVPGSGKTTAVGVMALKIASDVLGQTDKKTVIVAAATRNQVNKLQTVLEEGGLTPDSKSFLVGSDEKTPNLITEINKQSGELFAGVHTIMVDEASFMSNASLEDKIDPAKKIDITKHPDFSTFIASINTINENRRKNKMLDLNIILMGDPNQNGIVAPDGSGQAVSVKAIDNVFLPGRSPGEYLTEAERSKITTLNQSLDSILKVATHSEPLKDDLPINLRHGFDEESKMLLGVANIKTVDELGSVLINKSGDKNIIEILLNNIKDRPKFRIAIADDTYGENPNSLPETMKKNKVQMGIDLPILQPLLTLPNVELYTHDDIQGEEVDFTIVRVTKETFGNKFGQTRPQIMISGNRLNTSVSRSTLASVIINETDYPIDSVFVDGQKEVTAELNAKLSEELRSFQLGAFEGIPVITGYTGHKTAPSKAGPPTTPKSEPILPDENLGKTPKPKAGKKANDWVFKPADFIQEIDAGNYFSLPANYDGNVAAARKHMLNKAIYHLTGEVAGSRKAEKTLITTYVNAWNKISTSDNHLTPEVVREELNDDINIISLTNRHFELATVIFQLKGIQVPDGDYILHKQSLLFKDKFQFESTDHGIAPVVGVVTKEGDMIPLSWGALADMKITSNTEAKYNYAGEYRPLNEGELGYDPLTGHINSYDPEVAAIDVLIVDAIAPEVTGDSHIRLSQDAAVDYNIKRRREATKVLTQDPRWGEIYHSNAGAGVNNKIDVLKTIYADESVSSEMHEAAGIYLQYLEGVDMEMTSLSVDEFMAHVAVDGDKDMNRASREATDRMKALDKKGKVAIYTESFDAFTTVGDKRVSAGTASLVKAGEILEQAGFNIAPDSPNYREIIRGLMNKDSDEYQPTKFVTFAYRSTIPDKKTKQVYTTMMMAAQYQASDKAEPQWYVLGHFNNTNDPGPNLKEIQRVAGEFYGKETDLGKSIIGLWNPDTVYEKIFNQSKSLTSGQIVSDPKGAQVDLSEVEAMLRAQGLHPHSAPMILATPRSERDQGKPNPHYGKAMLLYSSDPNDTFENLKLGEDPEMGMFDGTRGAILLEPGFMELSDIMQVVKEKTPIREDFTQRSLLTKTLAMNHISTNIASSFAALRLEHESLFPGVLTESEILQLESLKKEANVPTWDPKVLRKLVNKVGDVNPHETMTSTEAAVAVISNLMRPDQWSGYVMEGDTYKLSKGSNGEPGNPMVEYGGTYTSASGTGRAPNPILYAKAAEGGFAESYIDFNFRAFYEAVYSYASNHITGPIKVQGKEVLDLDARVDIIISAIGGILKQTSQFKHGIQLLPVLASGSPEGDSVSMGSIGDSFQYQLRTNLKSISPPILYVNASGDGVSITDAAREEDYVDDQSYTAPEKETSFEVDGITYDIKALKSNFTGTMKASGIEDVFMGVNSLEERKSLYSKMSKSLKQVIDKAIISKRAADKYRKDLKGRINSNEFEDGKSSDQKAQDGTENLTIYSVDGSPFMVQLKQKDAGSFDLVNRTVNDLTVLDKLYDKIITSNKDKSSIINGLIQSSARIIADTALPGQVRKVLGRFVWDIQSKYENAVPSATITEQQEAITSALVSDIKLTSFLEPQKAGKNASIFEMFIEYATIPLDDPKYDVKRATVKDRILNTNSEYYDTILMYPLVKASAIDDVLPIMARKGDRNLTPKQMETAYKHQQKTFQDTLKQEYEMEGSSTNPYVVNAGQLARAIKGIDNIDSIVEYLTTTDIPNMFNLKGMLGLSTVLNYSIENAKLDKILIDQNQALFDLFFKEGILDRNNQIYKTLKLEVNAIADALRNEADVVYLGDDAKSSPAEKLFEMVGQPDVNYKKYIQAIIKGETAKNPNTRPALVEQKVENMINSSYSYFRGAPNAASRPSAHLMRNLRQYSDGFITMDKTAYTDLLDRNLIQEPAKKCK